MDQITPTSETAVDNTDQTVAAARPAAAAKLALKPIFNIAIIAHVDHGKTTLVDAMLRQSGTFRANEAVAERVMDSNDLERERGITILAKNTALYYHDNKINIVDTPGHADFGGEVERALKMVDGVVLLVDASEGPLPQTRYVLSKALEAKLTPMVVINKIDRPDARPQEVLNEVYDLFIDLDADEDMLDFPVLYTNGKLGTATTDPAVPGTDLQPLFEQIITDHSRRQGRSRRPGADPRHQPRLLRLPRPSRHRRASSTAPCAPARSTTSRESTAPSPSTRSPSCSASPASSAPTSKRPRSATSSPSPAFPASPSARASATWRTRSRCPPITIDEPTIAIQFNVNNSPFAGREGKWVTSRNLRDRLDKELLTNVSLKMQETGSPDTFKVLGRGELQLAHPDRNDAPRRLRDDGQPPGDRHQAHRRPADGAGRAAHDRHSGELRRHRHRAPWTAQGRDDQDDQSRLGPRAHGVPHPQPRPDRPAL